MQAIKKTNVSIGYENCAKHKKINETLLFDIVTIVLFLTECIKLNPGSNSLLR